MLEGLKKLFGNGNEAKIKKFQPIVEKINSLEEGIKALSDEGLKGKTAEFKERIKKGETLDDILPEAFAVVREASRRTLGERHFDVQLLGGIILHKGNIAEMRTGEGKTLVATLPVYLNALEGKGAHVVTVNDYLSRRDAVWMGQIYSALGMSVAVVNHEASFLYDISSPSPLPEGGSESSRRGVGENSANDSSHPSASQGLGTSPRAGEEEDKKRGGGEETNTSPHSPLTGAVQSSALAAPFFNRKSLAELQVFAPHPSTEGGRKQETTLDKKRDELGSFKVVHEFLKPCSRREAYYADITYGTNNEFGFDYLRDNLAYSEKDLRQRDYNFAIVDEVDSILIDEARTPLIISAPTVESEDLYGTFAKIATTLKKDEDYKVDEKLKAITLTDAGIEKAEKKLGVENIYTEKGIKYVHHLETAVRAKALFEKDKEYVIKDGEVIIVDEFTGRLQPGRRWSEGLHQAIEAKEGVAVQKESRTMASITFQNYFRFYKKLAGMTGTALTSSEEFYKVYGVDTIAVPTNKSVQRKDHNDLIFQTETGKFKAIARKVKELQKKGQPVLLGTVSIEKNELLGKYLRSEGVAHTMLNAKPEYAEKEGEIVAQAGRKGSVTVATNMAGRGVDIKLGGNPTTPELSEEVKNLGGLFVLGTERHEARRIDNQLRGRSGRQGDPGETQFFVSLEDSLMRIFASDTIKNLMGRFGIPEDEPIENRMITRSLETAQTKIEGFNFDARKHVLEYDDVLNHQRKIIYEKRRKILLGTDEEVGVFLEEVSSSSSSPQTRGGAEAPSNSSGQGGGELNFNTSSLNPSSTEGGRDTALFQKLSQKRSALGDAEFFKIARQVILQTIDMFWVEHLEVMDYMRGSVNLRAYGQRDPLVEYKREGLRMFKDMEVSVDEQILRILPNLDVDMIKGRSEQVRQMNEIRAQARLLTSPRSDGGQAKSVAGFSGVATPEKPATTSPAPNSKIGRNDPCWCNSGKKYKKCHGK